VCAGNYLDIARQLLREVPLHAHKKSYAAKKYTPAPRHPPTTATWRIVTWRIPLPGKEGR
jgi:hypothetical protein